MSLHIPGKNHTEAYVVGLAATNAMTIPSMTTTSTILAVIVVAPTASVAGGDVSDYTAGAGTITAVAPGAAVAITPNAGPAVAVAVLPADAVATPATTVSNAPLWEIVTVADACKLGAD